MSIHQPRLPALAFAIGVVLLAMSTSGRAQSNGAEDPTRLSYNCRQGRFIQPPFNPQGNVIVLHELSFECGYDARANFPRATAIGAESRADGIRATSLGNGARANSDNALAVGPNASATGLASIAFGSVSLANGINSTAVGAGATASFAGSTAIGANAATTAANQVALGGSGSSVRVGDIAASTAAQTGVVGIATVDALGTLGRNTAVLPAIAALQSSSVSQDNRVTALEASQLSLSARVEDLFDVQNDDRRDTRKGIAAAVAMAAAPMPSTPGRTSYVFNVATFRGEQAVGGSIMHRLGGDKPLAVGLGFSYAGNRNNAFRAGVAGEF